jgi:hypothetical protein
MIVAGTKLASPQHRHRSKSTITYLLKAAGIYIMNNEEAQ